ncbi:MAG: HNH endonuclease [Burkholderiales bacterium 28-67-8]|nr:MAG: HNH endonuclease [Burkholderiales bacterium 28-67-8]
MAGAKRDAHGKLVRSTEQKTAFKKSHPCPATGKSTGACPGYVIDHKVALKRGGADRPNNMQWQTKQAAKAKDKVE